MTTNDVTVLPDGSAFSTVSLPLPKDHWIYEPNGAPPAGMRTGIADPRRQELANMITMAARYAIRGATMSGKDADFDPDALVQNMIVGLLGYWTPTGHDEFTGDDPDLVRTQKAPLYRRQPTRVEAVQLRWSTWGEVCAFLGDIISVNNPGRKVDTYNDTCGEQGPFIELTIPTSVGPEIVRHGDWIVRDPSGLLYAVPRLAFAYSYQRVR